MADRYAQLVSESLASIAAEAPQCYAATSHAAAGLTLSITIDDEEITVVADPLLRVGAPVPRPSVWAATSSQAIAAILDGETTLEALVLGDALRVQGGLSQVARCHDVLLGYVHGAVRSPAVARLRPRFDHAAGIGR